MGFNSYASGNWLYQGGFTMISNLLIDHQCELGITNEELAFIVKIYKNVRGYKIHDSALDPSVSSRTLQRRRKLLKEKGLLDYTVFKAWDSEGHIKTIGISYDLSPLEEKLSEFAEKETKLQNSKAKKEIESRGIIIEEDDEKSPINIFTGKWKEYYGKSYRTSKDEIRLYNGLDEKHKKVIAYIIDYVKATGLDKKIYPRLALFLKVKYRFAGLEEWYEGNIDPTYNYDTLGVAGY